MPATLSTGRTQDEAYRGPGLVSLSDDAQEDLARAVRSQNHRYPELRKLWPAPACTDVCFTPEDLSGLQTEIADLLGGHEVSPGLRGQLLSLSALIEHARTAGLLLHAHIE